MWGTHKNKKIVDLRLLPNLAPNKCDTYVDVRNNMLHMFEGILHCFISDYFDLTHLALITRPWEKSQLIFRDSSVYTIPREGVAAYMTMTGNGFPQLWWQRIEEKDLTTSLERETSQKTCPHTSSHKSAFVIVFMSHFAAVIVSVDRAHSHIRAYKLNSLSLNVCFSS